MHERARRSVVVFAGGGTGGHLYPALALADALVARCPWVRPHFVGASRGLEARVLPERGLPHTLLPVRGLARGRVLENLGVPRALAASLVGTRALFGALEPELVVVTGGYAAAPAGLVAAAGGVRLAIQEQNAFPGATTRLLARWARQIHVGFPEAAARLPRSARGRVEDSGNPIRPLPAPPVDARAARAAHGLDPDRRLVLVVGGSQGSRALNERVLALVSAVDEGTAPAPAGWQLLWATGTAHHAAITAALGARERPWLRVRAYIDDLPALLPLASLAVSRAGAMATSEFLAAGLPALLMPLPTAAAGHQERNARALERAGAARVLPEAETDGARLRAAIDALAEDAGALEHMRRAALARARPEAAARIAERLAALLEGRGGPLGAHGGGHHG